MIQLAYVWVVGWFDRCVAWLSLSDELFDWIVFIRVIKYFMIYTAVFNMD